MNSFIEARNVRKEYQKGTQTIVPLENISLDIKGEFVVNGTFRQWKNNAVKFDCRSRCCNLWDFGIGSSILSEMNREINEVEVRKFGIYISIVPSRSSS